MPVTIPLHIPRHAFSLRERARAADIWRAFQEAAVLGSSAVGWPPPRYRDESCAFVVRRMTVVHREEARYGEEVSALTWVKDFRRGLLTTREIRLTAEGGRRLADATQEWVHVSFGWDEHGAVVLRPARAKPALLEAFPQEDLDPTPVMPDYEPHEGPTFTWDFPLWLTAMDPLNHVNHPAYVDIVDEHVSRRLMAADIDPVRLQPVAETVVYKAGLEAPGTATVSSRAIGRAAGGAVVLHHEIHAEDGTLSAQATTVRTLAGEGGDIAAAFA